MPRLNPSKKISPRLLKITKLDLRMIPRKDPRNSLKNSAGTENTEVLNFGLSVKKKIPLKIIYK
jgi:hypothetical protein